MSSLLNLLSNFSSMGGGAGDTTAPTCTITASAATITTAAFTVTITFTNPETGLPEAVTGFVLGDITVSANAGAGTLANPSTGVYTAVITPTTTGTVTIDVAGGVCTDAAGNANTAAVQFSILYVAPVLWMLADDISGNDGDAVSSWVSKEGGSHNFTQTLTKRPLLKKAANGINGHNTVLFDGSNDLLVCAENLSTATAGTVIAVIRLTASPSVDNTILGSMDEATGADYGNLFEIMSDTILKVRSWQRNNDVVDDNRGNTALSAGSAYIVTFSSSGTAYAHRVNGTAQTLNQPTGANNGDWFGDTDNRDNFTLGAIKYVGAEAAFMKGDIAELFLFDTQLTGNPLTAVESYLNTRYAVF